MTAHPEDRAPVRPTAQQPTDAPPANGSIPAQRTAPDTAPAHNTHPTPTTGAGARSVGARLAHLVVDLLAIATLVVVAIFGARLSTMPSPPPTPGSTQIRPVPAISGPGIRPGGRSRTGWLACPPGSLQPFPALTPLPGPPPPAGCHRY